MEDIIKGAAINSKGYGVIPKLVMQDRGLSITAKVIYAYLASYSGNGNCCFPSRDRVCSDLGIGKDTFLKHLALLKEKGYVTVSQMKDSGRFSHNVYTLNTEIVPCTVCSDTVQSDTAVKDTNNNSLNNNSIYNNNSNNIGKTKNRFVKPTIEEIRAYCSERNNTVDAESFYDFYESKGWVVGKSPMKDWKSAVRTWERSRNGQSKQYNQRTSERDVDCSWINSTKL